MEYKVQHSGRLTEHERLIEAGVVTALLLGTPFALVISQNVFEDDESSGGWVGGCDW